jgi:riboflavin kinase/FMN adenylyltransferase
VVTIGNFDGVHRGHQAILQRVLAISRSQNLVTVVMLFEPQPQEFFQGQKAPPRLMHWREKVEVFRELGIDYVLIARFNDDFRALTAQNFVDKVIVAVKCQHLVIGDDFILVVTVRAMLIFSVKQGKLRFYRRKYTHYCFW